MSAETPLERARRHWTREQWGQPQSHEQERLWCLFFTEMEPGETDRFEFNWTRPAKWIEDLIRVGAPRESEEGQP